MNSSAVMAFLHHMAAFTLVAALALEIALFRLPLSVSQARRLQRTDILFGVAAGLVLVIGLLRVFYFEKGPAYYWHNAYFLLKLGAFLLAALISIYPTITFLSWRPVLSVNAAPTLSDAVSRRVRTCLMVELLLIVVILACAALMARGLGMISV